MSLDPDYLESVGEVSDEHKYTKIDLPIAFINSHYFNDSVPEYKLRKNNMDFFKQN